MVVNRSPQLAVASSSFPFSLVVFLRRILELRVSFSHAAFCQTGFRICNVYVFVCLFFICLQFQYFGFHTNFRTILFFTLLKQRRDTPVLCLQFFILSSTFDSEFPLDQVCCFLVRCCYILGKDVACCNMLIHLNEVEMHF